MVAIKRDPADAAFSDCVRERAGWNCENCGKSGLIAKMECAHIIGRKNKRLRHDPDNALCLCFSCHLHYTANPLEFSDFVKSKLGEARLQIMQEAGRTFVKYNKAFVKECASHYRRQFRAMQLKRAAGETGYLEFDGFL